MKYASLGSSPVGNLAALWNWQVLITVIVMQVDNAEIELKTLLS